MTSGCLDRKEVRGAIWGVHSTTDRPAGGNTGRLFLAFGGPVCADRISNCPLDRVLTYKNLIYLLNLQFSVARLVAYKNYIEVIKIFKFLHVIGFVSIILSAPSIIFVYNQDGGFKCCHSFSVKLSYYQYRGH